MPPSPNHSIKSLVAQFETAWREGDRPWIADFVGLVDECDIENLFRELIPIDIDFRKIKAEKPRPEDYFQLGQFAVAIAGQELHEDFDSFNSVKDLRETALVSEADEGDENGMESFDSESMTTGVTQSIEATQSILHESESDFIGPYKLLQQIGQGGMGAVWMAEQYEPVRRRVALKVIRGDVVGKDTIARFEGERQAIAMMDHQNIAKILDAGTTQAGNPYFVMELVNGMPFHKYCDERKLNVRQRLELMIPVCRAIHHAHQKGIIHRDLKHQNVLITQYDGKPVPKVIDFGLAKAVEQTRLTKKTMFTEFGKVVGTIQYMSPEQAEMNAVDIDTRSDIYSLGVMLYKLLTGNTPLDNETLSSNSLIQLLALIREKEPLRPSVRLAKLNPASLNKLAARNGTLPDKMVQAVKGDIDWIIMKALEKERSHRYESANGMALDIERHLNNEEVRARPPSNSYRLEKFYKRNKRLVISAAIVSVALLLGVIGTSAGLFWAIIERDRANEEAVLASNETLKAQRSEREARKARSIAEAHLQAIRVKSAWSDWQLGNVESAWQMLSSLKNDEGGWESRYLSTEFASSENILYGHALEVTSVDVSPDDRFIVTCSLDNTLKFWDAKTKQLTFTRHLKDAPAQVCFSPDSTRLACADRSNCITIWNPANGEQTSTFGPFKEDSTCMAFSADGRFIVLGTGDVDSSGSRNAQVTISAQKPVIRVLDANNGSVLDEVLRHSESITAVDCSSDAGFIVSSSLDGKVRIWKKQDAGYEAQRSFTAHKNGVLDLALSPDNKTLATCGLDSVVELWNFENGDPVKSLIGHQNNVNCLEFSSDGTMLATGSSDSTARVWNLQGDELLVCKGHFDNVSDVSFSAGDEEILTASKDSSTRVWNSKTNPSTLVNRRHRDTIWAADFSPDDRRLVSASEDAKVCLMDVQTGEMLINPIQHDAAVLSLAHAPDKDVFVSGNADSKLNVFNSTDGSLVKTIEAHKGYIWDVSYSHDGKWLLSAGSDNMAKIWNTNDWTLVNEIEAHKGELGSARFSPDDQYFVTCGDDELVRLWETESCEMVHEFKRHQHSVWRAIFSPDGKTIASSSYDGKIILWDFEKRAFIHEIDAHQNQIAGLAFSKDGKRIVSASDDTTIKIWDVESRTELLVLRDRDDSAIVHVSFSNDGSKLVSGNQDGWITVRTTTGTNKIETPILPQTVVSMMIKGLDAVVSSSATPEIYELELKNAKKCLAHFPSYKAYMIKGIAQFRLGEIEESIESFKESQRIEPFEYGDPDLDPYIEGYLAMAYAKTGRLVQAAEYEAIFLKKSDLHLFKEEVEIQNLVVEVKQAMIDTRN